MNATETAPSPTDPSPAPSPQLSIADHLTVISGKAVTVAIDGILFHGLLRPRVSNVLVGYFEVVVDTRSAHWVDCVFPPERVRAISEDEGRLMLIFG